jgi:hypothetical protein
VNGGRCSDSTAPCFSHHIVADADTTYEQPNQLFPFMIATPGAWRGIQFYRFARGTHLPPGYPGTAAAPVGTSRESYWDCSSSNPARRWTSRAEIYCYVDFVGLIERLANEFPDVITTDAASVAATWGIGNANHSMEFPSCGGGNAPPVASAVAISGVAQVGNRLTGTYTYSDAEGDPQGNTTFRWLRNGSTAITGATGRTYDVVQADAGATLTFEVTPRASTGTLVGQPVLSAPTSPVTAAAAAPDARSTYVCTAQVCSINASGTSDADDPLTSLVFDWTFGDGSTARRTGVATISHAYSKRGKIRMSLRVTDPDGLSSTRRADIKFNKQGNASGSGR